MAPKRWRVLVVAVALTGGIAVSGVPPALADTTVPDGGGWAHAGAPPGGVSSDGVATPALPAGYTVRGIDVSSHDHAYRSINWSAVAASGVKFAYIKATEGTSYTNPYFAGDNGVQADYASARSAGLYVGAYHFGRPDHNNPVAQADYFIDHAGWGPDSKTLVPFLDIEWPYGSLSHLGTCWGLSKTAMASWIRSFVNRVAARIGRSPMIYTNRNWWNACLASNAWFGDTTLNLASYTAQPAVPPATWNTFAIWQYAAGNPRTGSFDRDVINGDLHALSMLAGATPPTVVSLRAHVNGRFVTADNAGRAPLVAGRWAVGSWEQFDEVDLGNDNIALRSHINGHYVTAERAGTRPLIANRMALGSWETFHVITHPDGSVSLRSAVNGRYVAADRQGAGPLIANRTWIGSWEVFDLVPAPTTISLRAHANNNYVSADNGGSRPLIANRWAVGSWERFQKFDLGNGHIALRSLANGRIVTAEAAGSRPLIANRTAILSWETFTLVSNQDSTVSLLSAANGQYVTADSGSGLSTLIASSTSVGAAEEFDLL